MVHAKKNACIAPQDNQIAALIPVAALAISWYIYHNHWKEMISEMEKI